MKELYSFQIERTVEKEVPVIKEAKDGSSKESIKKVTEKIPHRIVLAKPSQEDIENAEFFYGQKYNEFINAGFLTKAMLAKKMGDLGGMSSKMTNERIQSLFLDSIEASKTIEFFSGAKNLTEEQKNELKEAEKTFIETKTAIADYEEMFNGQFKQTADNKADLKLVEWLVFNFSYYEDEVDDKKQLFPIFKGENYEEKRAFYLKIAEEEKDIDDISLLKIKKIYDQAFTKLIRAINIWYNKMGDDQKSIDDTMKQFFDE